MALQLELTDLETEPARWDASRFTLDARTRAIGLAGVARARAVLEAARLAHDSDDAHDVAA